jgi:monothiol glutaredoxin
MTNEEIQKIIDENKVVLFMKGTKDFPQCGFSGLVTKILGKVETEFQDVNVLDDASGNLRDEIKQFSDWPTIPQLYIKGEFVGGCDIVREMYEDGSLAELLKEPKQEEPKTGFPADALDKHLIHQRGLPDNNKK